jgi:hypothetical protein
MESKSQINVRVDGELRTLFHSKNATESLIASRSRYSQRTIRLIRNRGKDGWLLGFGTKN